MAPKHKVGDRLRQINDYEVVIPTVKTVTEIEATDRGYRYYIEPTDTPWFAVAEKNLHPLEER